MGSYIIARLIRLITSLKLYDADKKEKLHELDDSLNNIGMSLELIFVDDKDHKPTKEERKQSEMATISNLEQGIPLIISEKNKDKILVGYNRKQRIFYVWDIDKSEENFDNNIKQIIPKNLEEIREGKLTESIFRITKLNQLGHAGNRKYKKRIASLLNLNGISTIKLHEVRFNNTKKDAPLGSIIVRALISNNKNVILYCKEKSSHEEKAYILGKIDQSNFIGNDILKSETLNLTEEEVDKFINEAKGAFYSIN